MEFNSCICNEKEERGKRKKMGRRNDSLFFSFLIQMPLLGWGWVEEENAKTAKPKARTNRRLTSWRERETNQDGKKKTCKWESSEQTQKRGWLFHCLFAVNCNLEYNLYISRGKEKKEKGKRMMMMPTFIFTHHLLLSSCPLTMYTNSYIQWMNQTLFQFVPSPFLSPLSLLFCLFLLWKKKSLPSSNYH